VLVIKIFMLIIYHPARWVQTVRLSDYCIWIGKTGSIDHIWPVQCSKI